VMRRSARKVEADLAAGKGVLHVFIVVSQFIDYFCASSTGRRETRLCRLRVCLYRCLYLEYQPRCEISRAT
jgi:hypothetical protein